MRKAVKGAGRVAATGWAWPWLRALMLTLGFFLIVRSFLIEAFRIPTGSMENTLLAGDFLLVNKAVFGARLPLTAIALPALAEPRRGDLLGFAPSTIPIGPTSSASSARPVRFLGGSAER